MLLSVLSVIVVAVAVGAFVLTSGGSGSSGSGSTPTTAGSTVTTLPEAQFTSFRDSEGGFTIRYPRSWQRFSSADPSVRLVVAATASDGLTVRVNRTEVPTTLDNIQNLKVLTDGLVASNKTAKILQQRQITINGMPGYYYLYTFTDEPTGRQGAHAHYFLFRGRKMNALVFQAVPTEGFTGLAAVFDQIAESFQSDPDIVPSTPPTT